MEVKRERLSSRLGFILLSVGCAVGLGNVWRFPYVVGKNGGAIFVLVYLFFLAVFGLPIMVMELSVEEPAKRVWQPRLIGWNPREPNGIGSAIWRWVETTY